MRYANTILAMAAALGALLISSVPTYAEPGVPGVSDLIADRLMVRTVDPSALAPFIAAYEANNPDTDLNELDSIPGRPIYLLEYLAPVPPNPDQLELDLVTNYGEFLVWGELLYENSAPEGHTGSTWVDSPVNASLYQEQYSVPLLGLEVARSQSTGAGVAVAVLDTGIDASHPALQARILSGGYDFLDDDSDTCDAGEGLMVGHGTYVAGLIALTAPDASILPVRVLGTDGVGDGWALTEGMYFAIDAGVEVINLSLGSTYDAQGVEDAIQDAMNQGIVTVAAAGNLNRSDPEEYPAMKSDPFGVAATDDQDTRADFSNFNDKIFLSAPGATFFVGGDPQQPDPARAIVSTIPGGEYAIWSGTSMSTPFVSGAVALIRAQHPEWLRNLGTYGTVASILESSAVDIDDVNPAYAGLLGEGRLDIAAAVAQGPIAPGPGDLNNDGTVDVADLVQVITNWGPCPPPPAPCASDGNGDDRVDVGDLLVVILNWGR